MSSSRLMDVGRAITPGEPRISKSVALALIGLVGFIFMCSVLFWVGSSITGMFGGDVVAQDGNAQVVEYGHRDSFPVITAADRVDCLARPRWYIATIETPTKVIYECLPQ